MLAGSDCNHNSPHRSLLSTDPPPRVLQRAYGRSAGKRDGESIVAVVRPACVGRGPCARDGGVARARGAVAGSSESDSVGLNRTPHTAAPGASTDDRAANARPPPRHRYRAGRRPASQPQGHGTAPPRLGARARPRGAAPAPDLRRTAARNSEKQNRFSKRKDRTVSVRTRRVTLEGSGYNAPAKARWQRSPIRNNVNRIISDARNLAVACWATGDRAGKGRRCSVRAHQSPQRPKVRPYLYSLVSAVDVRRCACRGVYSIFPYQGARGPARTRTSARLPALARPPPQRFAET